MKLRKKCLYLCIIALSATISIFLFLARELLCNYGSSKSGTAQALLELYKQIVLQNTMKLNLHMLEHTLYSTSGSQRFNIKDSYIKK